MPAAQVDQARIRDHVVRLGELYPPIDPDSADYSVRDPATVSRRFAIPLDFMARVEMEVERNVLELAVMLPSVSELDRLFYADVWGPQEVRHGALLDRLVAELGLPAPQPDRGPLAPSVRVMGALAHMTSMHDIIRMLYYITGAATERSAILAYQSMSDELEAMGETAIKRTVIDAIKVQEPGHFAFYRLSAAEMIQNKVLAPWQLHVVRFVRSKAFSLVGAETREEKTQFGGTLVQLGLAEDVPRLVREVTRVENQLLWAADQGMAVPRHALKAFQDAIDLYRAQAAQAA